MPMYDFKCENCGHECTRKVTYQESHDQICNTPIKDFSEQHGLSGGLIRTDPVICIHKLTRLIASSQGTIKHTGRKARNRLIEASKKL